MSTGTVNPTTATATLQAMVREAQTDAATELADIFDQVDALGLTPELAGSVKVQVVAGRQWTARLGELAQAELDRRAAHSTPTHLLPYIR